MIYCRHANIKIWLSSFTHQYFARKIVGDYLQLGANY